TMQWTFDLKPDDVFWCTADIGWTTGRVRRRAVAACIPMHRHRTVEADDPLIDTYREWGSPICCAMHCNSRSALQDLQHCHADVLSR
ncbi:hypothetical protein, partial [Ralstonia pseudosolanacearum]|uniref:hypothetical protein n=1 Tax=Ralstonia pseudosolanacearum TaxID=1310165 RepID=UPI003D17578F